MTTYEPERRPDDDETNGGTVEPVRPGEGDPDQGDVHDDPDSDDTKRDDGGEGSG